MGRVVFLSVISALALGLSAALWPRLRERRARNTLLAVAAGCVLVWLVPVLLGLSVFGTIPLVGRPLKFLSSMWFAVCFVTILLGVPALLLRGALLGGAWTWTRVSGGDRVDPGRRAFLRTVGRGVPATAALSSVVGTSLAELPCTLRRVDVKLHGLPPALDGFRIGQTSDTHVGAFVSPADVARAIRRLDAEGVDLQVMTGDLSDDIAVLDETVAGLGANKARHGLFAIFGNHEHYRGPRHFFEAYRKGAEQGGRLSLLVNQSTVLEHNGARIRLVGVDYAHHSSTGRSPEMERFAKISFADAQPGETVICLAHDPNFFDTACDYGARLTLSGHTHGGQVAVIGPLMLKLFFKYVLGRYERGDHVLYVSGGTGHWLPFRIGVPKEITVLTLRAV